MSDIDQSKTLEEIEGVFWEEPQINTSLVLRCHRLRKTPLKDFSVNDLRVMIGQQLSLEYLVPIAFCILALNPFVEGKYQGDLLSTVLQIPQSFWELNTDLYYQLDSIVIDAKSTIDLILPLLNSYKRLHDNDRIDR